MQLDLLAVTPLERAQLQQRYNQVRLARYTACACGDCCRLREEANAIARLIGVQWRTRGEALSWSEKDAGDEAYHDTQMWENPERPDVPRLGYWGHPVNKGRER